MNSRGEEVIWRDAASGFPLLQRYAACRLEQRRVEPRHIGMQELDLCCALEILRIFLFWTFPKTGGIWSWYDGSIWFYMVLYGSIWFYMVLCQFAHVSSFIHRFHFPLHHLVTAPLHTTALQIVSYIFCWWGVLDTTASLSAREAAEVAAEVGLTHQHAINICGVNSKKQLPIWAKCICGRIICTCTRAFMHTHRLYQ